MRFTSLIIELLRARPRLMLWIVVLFQAALWLILPLLLYRSPPGDLATVLAYGREYQVGTYLGPPLAFWLADIAFRAAGNYVFGVYLLAQLCAITTFVTLFQLSRAIVGGQQAVLAVLLTMTVTAFSSPGVEFGPLVLARPLWALLLLHSWQIMGQGRRNAWFAWSIEAGLLLLTIPAAIGLLMLVTGFALATERGRRTLMSFDPLFALLVIVVLALPYLIWLMRADTLALPPWPAIADLGDRALHWAGLLGGLLLAISGIVLLVVINSGWFGRNPEDAPIIFRPPVDPLARDFVYFFAIAPALAGSLISGLFGGDRGDRRPRSSAASASAASGLGGCRHRPCDRGDLDDAIAALDRWRGSDLAARNRDRAFFWRQLRAADQSPAARGDRRRAACDPDLAGCRPSASAARRGTGTNALADIGEIYGDRRRRGLARIRYGRHAAGRHRATISRPGAGSAAGVRVAGDRAAAAAADRLGHRPTQDAVSDVTPHGEERIFKRLETCGPSCLILRDAAKTPLLRAREEYRPHPER